MLNQNDIINKYGTLTEDVFKQKTMYQRAYYSLFLFFRLILGLILVYMYKYPMNQIFIIFVMQVLQIAYLIKYRPFKLELQQVLVVTDEFTIIVGLIFLYFMWDHQNNIEHSLRIGYLIIGVLCISLLKNFGTLFYISITSGYLKFREWAHKKLNVKSSFMGLEKSKKRKRRLNQLPKSNKKCDYELSYKPLSKSNECEEHMKRVIETRNNEFKENNSTIREHINITQLDYEEVNKNRRRNRRRVRNKYSNSRSQNRLIEKIKQINQKMEIIEEVEDDIKDTKE